MIKVKDIAYVGYPVSDVKKARDFYEGILGLVPNDDFPPKEDSQFVEYNIGSGALSIGCMESWKPSKDGPCAALEIEDIDGALKELKEKGIEFVMEYTDFPGCGMAIIRDPDGNMIVIHHKK